MSLDPGMLCAVLMAVVAVVAVMVINRRSTDAVERMSAALERAHKLYAADVRQLLERVLMLKGMHPHHAAPESFTPAGHSWQVHEELKGLPVEAPDMGSDDVVAERELAQDLREWAEEERREMAVQQAMGYVTPQGTPRETE